MTTALARAQSRPGPPVLRTVDPLGTALEAIGRRLGASCLLESRDGRIVSHVLSHEPVPSVASAILKRTAAPLHEAARRPRTAAVMPGGAMTILTIPDWPGAAVVTPVVTGGVATAWLWILLSSPGLPDV